MFRFGIGITDKPQVVESTLRAFNNNCFVVTLEEQGSIYNLDLNNFTKGTVLLPPPSAEIAAIDGDEHKFTELYYAHLCDLNSLEFVTLMMLMAYYTMPVLIYIPTDSLYLAGFLRDFFRFNFGVSPAVDSVVMPPDTKFEICNVYALFYLFDFIDINTFINLYLKVGRAMMISLVPIQDLVLTKFAGETGFMNSNQYYTRELLYQAKVDHFLRFMNSNTTIVPFTLEGGWDYC